MIIGVYVDELPVRLLGLSLCCLFFAALLVLPLVLHYLQRYEKT